MTTIRERTRLTVDAIIADLPYARLRPVVHAEPPQGLLQYFQQIATSVERKEVTMDH